MVSLPFGAAGDGGVVGCGEAEGGAAGTVQRSLGRFPGLAVFEQRSRDEPAVAVASILGHEPPTEAADAAGAAAPSADTATRTPSAQRNRRDRNIFMRR